MNWHQADIQQVFQMTGSSSRGLSDQSAKEKLAESGPNILQQKKKKTPLGIFIRQFKDFMILVLIAAAIISGFVGDFSDTIIILVIVLLNAVLGFVQEYRAEKAIDALKKMAAPSANVLRNGKPASIPSSDVVPGDVVLLEAGSLVPADLRLMEVHALRIDESALTGESVPVDKITDTITEDNIVLADQLNMAWKGTVITNGRGMGITIATGMNTEIGKIAGALHKEEAATPLQIRMAAFGRKLSYLILVICGALFVIGLLRGEEPVKMLLVSISLAVAAIPEALPALITIALARGARRLVMKHALMRRLPAVETLGSVTFICSDKTGTLTLNKMKVTEVCRAPQPLAVDEKLSLPGIAMLLNNDATLTGDGKWQGDPTEIALIEYEHKHHGAELIDEILMKYPRVEEIPFDSGRKRMTTIHRYGDKFMAISKGAAESIAKRLKDHSMNEQMLRETTRMASQGMRVLAFGYRILDYLPETIRHEDIEKDLEHGGLAGMIDPPRENVRQAIEECKTAGVHVVMITGDHRDTAIAIAKEIGILAEGDLVITGAELARLEEEELDRKIEKIRVYARVSPEQKLNIVKSLQRSHHFVAMTGDGVNDAPGLRTANIGIAMGITGTDVSKQAAHMILLDDNFVTIVRAIREGRRIYDNIRKFVRYIMTCNSAEIWTIFLASLIGLPIPLQPIHILWINLVTDGLPGLALSAETADKNIMHRPPRKTNESLFDGGTGYHIIWVGLLMAFIVLAVQAIAIRSDDMHWQTMVFTVLSLSQLGHVFAVRSEVEFIYRKGFFSNRPLFIVIVMTFLLQLGVIYLPFANEIFKTQPLSVGELGVCLLTSAIVFHAVEVEKWIRMKRNSRRN